MITQSAPEGHMSAAHVDDVDAFSRRLYRRARTAGPAFSDIASVVRSIHTVLKHLKSEIEDPVSLLCSSSSSVYARQLTPLVEDCDFALQQLEVVLDKYNNSNAANIGDGPKSNLMPGEMGWVLERAESDRLELIRAKLATQKLNIDMFLDTVQLRNTARRHDTPAVDTSHVDMDSIKDKVDAIATRICQFKDSDSADDDEELWQKFRDELVHEGFSEDVLRQNQDVLRAYIRQLDQQAMTHDGSMPSVRGFLEQYNPSDDPGLQLAPYEDPGLQLAPYEEYPAPAELSAQAMYQSPRVAYATSDDTRSLDKYQPAELEERGSGLSYEYYSSEDEDLQSNSSLALISTRDLMAIDRRSNDLAIAQANRGLPAPHDPFANAMEHPVGSPASNRYLPPSASHPALIPPPGAEATSGALVGPSCTSPPPVLHSNSISAPAIAGESPSLPRATRLAPDSQGQDIPLDAKWTRIKRSLVCIEVLSQRGMRFEARPTFVAILGALSREEIEELARRSAEVREMRKVAASKPSVNGGANGASKPRRPEDRYHPDKYRNWDIETPQDPKHNGYVINPSGRREDSHASEVSDLYDSSDDTESESGYTDNEDRFRPPPRHKSQPYHHTQSELRSRRDSVVSHGSSGSDHGNGDDDKGTKSYPFIVPAPTTDNRKATNGDGASPAATVQPKPILKNKGEPTHVRFDPEPHVLDETMSSPSRSLPRRSGRSNGSGRERSHHSDRHADRDTREKERERERDRDSHRDYGQKYDNRDRTRFDRDREDYYRDDYDSWSHRPRRDRGESLSSSAPSSYGRRKDSSRRRGRNGALSAAGIGGAAASLLSVLTEAAAAL